MKMDTGKAIFFGMALIVLAVFARDALWYGNQSSTSNGRYVVSPATHSLKTGLELWITDTQTGTSRLCNLSGCLFKIELTEKLPKPGVRLHAPAEKD